MGDLNVNSYSPSNSVCSTDDVDDAQTATCSQDSVSDAAVGSQGGNTTVADLPKAPLGDPVTANAFKAKLANMDGTDRTCPGVNVCVNFQGSPEFQALPKDVQAKLLQDIQKDPGLENRLNQVMDQPAYKGMNTQQRTELLNVWPWPKWAAEYCRTQSQAVRLR